MKSLVALTLFLLMTWSAVGEEKLVAIGGRFEVKNVPLRQAIHALNRVINDAHPGRKDLLIAYVEARVIPEYSKEPLDAAWKKEAPIKMVVEDLTRQCLCHWIDYDGVIVVYGWHEANHEPKAEQDGAGQPATAPESKPEGKEKPKPDSKVRP